MTDEVCGCHLQWVQAYPATFHTFETLKQGRYLGFLLLSELLTFLLCFVKKKKKNSYIKEIQVYSRKFRKQKYWKRSKRQETSKSINNCKTYTALNCIIPVL